MFETRFPQRVTAYAAGLEQFQKDYGAYGHALKKHFDPNQPIGPHAWLGSTGPTTRSVGAGWPRPTATRTSRSRTCRSACSAPRRREAARRRRDRGRDPRSRGRAGGRPVLRRGARGRPRPPRPTTLNRLFALGAGPRRALRARLSELLARGRRRAEQAGGAAAPRRRLHDAPAGPHRRLHRFLRRHPPRDQRRQAVPARQSAAAELQVRADRLSRPRLLGACPSGTPGPPPERPAQAARRAEPELRPVRAAGLRAGARRSGSVPATSWASPSRSARRPSISPASAC